MFKKLASVAVSLSVVLAVLVANGSVWPTSMWAWHQPEVPTSLRK